MAENFEMFEKDDFDVIKYINQKFPDEHSLENLDKEIELIKQEIERLDEEILEDIHEHALLNQKTKMELDNTHVLTKKLIGEIKVFSWVDPAKIAGKRNNRPGNVQGYQDPWLGQEKYHFEYQLFEVFLPENSLTWFRRWTI